MINKRRVQRIRGFLYTCIVLLIFVPVVMMIVVSFKTLGILKDLRAYFAQAPSSGVVRQIPDNGSAGLPEIGGTDAASTPGPQDLTAGTEPAAQTGTEENSQVDEAAGDPPADDGRYVENTYLPVTYPNLYFDTVPLLSTSEKNTLYLTFDNTPSSESEEILSVLKKHGVHGTFFVWWNDSMGEQNHAFYKRLVADGHQIGIHSASNSKTYSAMYADVQSFLAEYSEIFDTIQSQTGVAPRFYRLPGGSVHPYDQQRQQVLLDIKAELDARGFLQYDWSSSAQDAVSPALDKDQILGNIQRFMDDEGSNVILLHDGTGSTSTAEALDEFISRYKQDGYSFGVLDFDTKPVSFLGDS